VVQFKIVGDNRVWDKRLKASWGFSCLVGKALLFDTDEDEITLRFNMKMLRISPQDLTTIVISHDHYDHTGGLSGVLKQNPRARVYGLSNFSASFKQRVRDFGAELIEKDEFSQIAPGIYLTGELTASFGRGSLPEQSLVVKTDPGLVIITGCSHPGIVRILEKVKNNLKEPIYLVLGGFHLMEKAKGMIEIIVKEFHELGVKKVAPTHCTGEEAIGLFREEYKENFLPAGVGKIIKV
jgi:7,8-dihydropterin-6-yl-methyl-4-(beta-D-ribofuranosyl)aminobenzene 5'-phosphate synthase